MKRALACMAMVSGLGAAAATLIACSDLFHATDDFKTGCEIDASDDACAAPIVDGGADVDALDAPPDGPLDFCKWTAERSRTTAERTCMLLGMCEAPMGKQRFGECVVHALLAYDCNANANRQVKGAAKDFWACMADVTSCGGVEACTFPDSQTCPSARATLCSDLDPATRVDCPGPVDAAVRTENCAAWGQTCASEGSFAICAGQKSGFRCSSSGCAGAVLNDCPTDGGNNVGVDCTSFGARACVGSGIGSACAAEGDTPCAPTVAITCDGDVARSCPSGVEEKVNCSVITRKTGTCNAAAVSSATLGAANGCFPQSACADSATSEACSGNTLHSCFRGIDFAVDCASTCALVQTADGTRAACVKP